jgi:hypothetical protein
MATMSATTTSGGAKPQVTPSFMREEDLGKMTRSMETS